MQLMGAAPAEPLRLSAVAVNRLDKAPGRLEFQRGIYRRNDRGDLEVSGFSAQGAHRLAGMSRANCLIVLPLECSGIEPGQRVDIEPLDFPVI
jgi:molybdopterin molybdotransferase